MSRRNRQRNKFRSEQQVVPVAPQEPSSASDSTTSNASESCTAENKNLAIQVVTTEENVVMTDKNQKAETRSGADNKTGTERSASSSTSSNVTTSNERDLLHDPIGARIKVIGIGGGGGNAVNNMIRSGLRGVEFVAANTDAQALRSSDAPTKMQLGNELTKGLGAGANPSVGEGAARESADDIRAVLQGADMVFVTAGMGGGTGGGGAAVVASIARELGALTVGVVTKPFLFEGKRRMSNADSGIEALKREVDTLITIPNQRLLSVSGRNTALPETQQNPANVFSHAGKGITDLIVFEGRVSVASPGG